MLIKFNKSSKWDTLLIQRKKQLLYSANAITSDQHKKFKGGKEDSQNNSCSCSCLLTHWNDVNAEERFGLMKVSEESGKTNSRDCADPLKETG